MKDYPKRVKKFIRQYAAIAYEIELSSQLEKLSCRFDDWKQGKISSSELERLIHEFHSGSARDLFNKYNGSSLDMSLAYAIVTGVLIQDEMPDELLQHLNPAIQFYQEQV